MIKLLAVALGVLCLAERLSSADSIASITEFQVIDSWDDTDTPAVVTSLNRVDKGTSYLSRCRGPICLGLPFGAYRYSLKLSRYPKAPPIEGRAMIGYPTFLVTVRRQVGEHTGMSLPGQVLGVAGSGRMWIRASAIFFDYSVDARVRPNGRFDLHGLIRGKYLITVLENGKVLGYQRWDCCNDMQPDQEMRTIEVGGKKILAPRTTLQLGTVYRPKW